MFLLLKNNFYGVVMKIFLSLWTISLFLMVALDFIWFNLMLEKFYKPYIGHIISGEFNYLVAAIFYLLYSAGLTYLITFPALESNYMFSKVALNGFVLGIIAYGAYDLTNQATIKNWPLIVTIVDMSWGGFVTSVTGSFAYKIIDFFRNHL
jgi:uncharacterized membrane protein